MLRRIVDEEARPVRIERWLIVDGGRDAEASWRGTVASRVAFDRTLKRYRERSANIPGFEDHRWTVIGTNAVEDHSRIARNGFQVDLCGIEHSLLKRRCFGPISLDR